MTRRDFQQTSSLVSDKLIGDCIDGIFRDSRRTGSSNSRGCHALACFAAGCDEPVNSRMRRNSGTANCPWPEPACEELRTPLDPIGTEVVLASGLTKRAPKSRAGIGFAARATIICRSGAAKASRRQGLLHPGWLQPRSLHKSSPDSILAIGLFPA